MNTKKPLSTEEIKGILELLQEAYKEAGKTIQTAVVYRGDDEEMLIDNRDEKDIN